MDCIVHGVSKSGTPLRTFTFTVFKNIVKNLEFPRGLLVRILTFTAQAWVQFLVGELRSHTAWRPGHKQKEMLQKIKAAHNEIS